MTHIEVDLFSLYVLFSHFRSRDGTLENCFFQMSYARASTWTSRGLNWENKTYRLKRSISLFLSSYFASKPRDKGRMLVINTIHFFLQNLIENRVEFAVEKNIFAQTAHMIAVTSCVNQANVSLHMNLIATRPIVMKRSDAYKASTKTIQP